MPTVAKKIDSKYDLLKYGMAVMIIALHSGFTAYPIATPLLRIAVPVFFILSSMFFFQKAYLTCAINKDALGRFIKRSCGLYFFWLVVLAPYVIQAKPYFEYGWLRGVTLFVADLLFYNTFPASWFLSALLLCTVFVASTRKRLTISILGG